MYIYIYTQVFPLWVISDMGHTPCLSLEIFFKRRGISSPLLSNNKSNITHLEKLLSIINAKALTAEYPFLSVIDKFCIVLA